MATVIEAKIIKGPDQWGLIQDSFLHREWVNFHVTFSLRSSTTTRLTAMITGLHHGEISLEWKIFGFCKLDFQVKQALKRMNKSLVSPHMAAIYFSGKYNHDRKFGVLQLTLPE
jgi:hypothetical protein